MFVKIRKSALQLILKILLQRVEITSTIDPTTRSISPWNIPSHSVININNNNNKNYRMQNIECQIEQIDLKHQRSQTRPFVGNHSSSSPRSSPLMASFGLMAENLSQARTFQGKISFEDELRPYICVSWIENLEEIEFFVLFIYFVSSQVDFQRRKAVEKKDNSSLFAIYPSHGKKPTFLSQNIVTRVD